MIRPPIVERETLAARLRLAVTRLNRRLRAEADSGLTASGISALATIGRRGPLPLGELAAAEGVKPPTMTATVAALEAEGLVARSADGRDRRVSKVSLTARGRQRLDRARTRKTAYLAARLERLDEVQLEQLDRAVALFELVLEEDG
ncbi:MAG: MarR family transcriptional regulator [Candidatus Dormibacteraeota bacterium]|jgi:DNA-binding MarR family transcriptional regulator|nr:MarR family transcriptional regulator [Candidatus Dormibacteraeota bacterium]